MEKQRDKNWRENRGEERSEIDVYIIYYVIYIILCKNNIWYVWCIANLDMMVK